MPLKIVADVLVTDETFTMTDPEKDIKMFCVLQMSCKDAGELRRSLPHGQKRTVKLTFEFDT